MKREQAAIALLLLLLAIALWNVHHADFLTDQLEENLLRSERALSRGDRDMALTALDNALSLWQRSRGYTGVFFRHPDVDAASDAFYELQQLLLQRDAEGAEAAYARLRYHLDTLDDMEHLSWGTVF